MEFISLGNFFWFADIFLWFKIKKKKKKKQQQQQQQQTMSASFNIAPPPLVKVRWKVRLLVQFQTSG